MADKETRRPGRPKSEEKARAIMEAATALFLERGFSGTAMDAVAQCAGVSKQTVYSHFASKEALFAEAVGAKVATYGFEGNGEMSALSVRDTLLAITRQVTGLLCDPVVVDTHRLMIAEAKSQPQIAALFYESGPQRTVTALAGYLGQEVARGRLHIAEADLLYAATQLIFTAMGWYQLKNWLGVQQEIPQEELQHHIGHVVDDFLRLYGDGSDNWRG